MEKPLRIGRIAFNVSEDIKNRLLKAEMATGVLAVHMLAKASESICNYVEKNKQIVMPFSVIPTQELEAIQARLAEVEVLQARVTKLETENELLKSQGLNTDAPVSRSARIGTGVIETARKRSGIKA